MPIAIADASNIFFLLLPAVPEPVASCLLPIKLPLTYDVHVVELTGSLSHRVIPAAFLL